MTIIRLALIKDYCQYVNYFKLYVERPEESGPVYISRNQKNLYCYIMTLAIRVA